MHSSQNTVETATQRGWQTLKSGELLRCAENAGFDVLLAADKSIKYQQNLGIRKIALVVLGNPPMANTAPTRGARGSCREFRHTWQLRGSGNT